MTYALRDYQAHAVEQSVAFLRAGHGQGGLVVLPTGAGKSLVIAGIATALDGPCMVFQPTKEILEQNANKLLAYGFMPKVYSASMGLKEIGSITLATIGSVKGVPHLFNEFPYVLVDEAHLVNAKEGMYRDFLAALGDVRVVGLTATPYRLSTDGYGGSMLKFLTRTRPRAFSDVLAYAQVGDLIAQGYLARPSYQIVSGFHAAEIARNTTGADFDDEAVKRYYKRIGFADRLRRVVVRLLEIGRTSIVVFARYVEECEQLVLSVPGAVVVSAQTKASERAAIIKDFRAGAIPVVANVGVLGLGFDYPELATVVLARPTLSLTVYYQQCGRVLRPHPSKVEDPPWIIDMVDNTGQFGKVEDLWLQPGGPTGQQWEMVSRTTGTDRVLTNKYLGDGKFQPRNPKWRKRAG